MYKKLSLAAFIALCSLAQADDENLTRNIEILASKIDGTKTTANAADNVLVFYGDAILKSDSAFFDKNSSLLTLDGNIESMGYAKTKEQTSHMVLNTLTNDTKSDSLFLTNENDIWLYTDSAKKYGNLYFLGHTMLSSCSLKDPLWKMVFDNSVYDDQNQLMKLYSIKLYMGDIPIFYIPYLSFTTNNERKSGLLFPKFGYSGDTGILYEQPIFWAPYLNWDIEFNPQIRSKRSVGIYGTFRFADTPNSSGEFRIGNFSDFDDYYRSHDLRYQNHYGAELLYDSSKLFELPYDFKDGLYINAIYLNDIDYLNLQKSKLEHFGITNFQESRLNYFAQNNDYFALLNAKYFIDTTKESNSDTIQVLPSFEFHKFYDQISILPLYYSADFSFANYYRQRGSTLKRADFTLPFELSQSFFDDYLRITLSEELYVTKLFFGGIASGVNDFSFASNTNKISISSDLTKRYENYTHTLQPSFSYSNLGKTKESPVSYDLIGVEQKKLYTLDLPKEQYKFSLSQYLYDNSSELNFFERLSQVYYPKENYNFSDLEHEFGVNYKNFSISNQLLYSYEFSKFRSIYTNASWHNGDLSLGLSHAYKKDIMDELNQIAVANNINLDTNYKFNKNLSLYGGFSYELDNKNNKFWNIGASYNKDCFGLSLALSKTSYPALTQAGASYTDSINFYIQLKFIPFATLGTSR
ncbi:MAG: LPS-assembly protein LptD [Epsilonproteobacteria bacterium]|nr:LPS-assembly protein LptD [Campylobacterota bacterium]